PGGAAAFGEALPEKGWRAGPLLIIAGAGTGKTSTLAHRVAHLVLNGVDPGRILLLTFTRRAAVEMRRRTVEIVRRALDDTLGSKSQKVANRLGWTGTFHAIGNRLLRHYAPHLKLDPQFTVVDRGDSADLLDSVRQELGLAAQDKRFPRKDTCLAIYSHRVNTGRSLKETLEVQFPWCLAWEAELTRLFRTYVERKQQYGLLDYDDLLLYWNILMSEPRLAQHVGAHFDHVLVDEYQDTNALQAQILRAMKPQGDGVTVVGDDAQSIYSFRAAAIENILDFDKQYTPPAEIVLLAQNYRSTQPVLDASNALMAEAPRQHRKHLLAARGESGARPKYVSVDDTASQAEYVALQVLRRREANVPLRRQAVLFRSGSHSDLLEVELMRRKIPFVKYGGLKFLEAAHVKDMLCVLRWADNPRNQLAAFRVLQLLPGMGPANARKVIESMESAGGGFGALQSMTPPPGAQLDLPRLATLLSTLTEPGKPMLDEDYLVLSTVHSAKGMEWDTVFLLNVVDGSFPSEFSTGKQQLLDEERRLLYVAMTRARDELQLISPLKFPITQQAPRGDAHVYGGRSRFVNEKLLKTFEQTSFQGSHIADGGLGGGSAPLAIDASERLKSLW
ncbi:MAG: ATP-dependent helicase, partial [Proteobacteria bacterium]